MKSYFNLDDYLVKTDHRSDGRIVNIRPNSWHPQVMQPLAIWRDAQIFFTFKILPSLIWVKLVQKFLCWKMSSKFSFAHDDDVELLTVFCKSHLKSRSWNDQMSSRHKIAFDLSQQTVTTRQWQCHYTGWPKNMKKCGHLIKNKQYFYFKTNRC